MASHLTMQMPKPRFRSLPLPLPKALALALLGCLLAGTACKRRDPASFAGGRESIQAGRWQEGIRQLEFYLDAAPNGPFASRAQFMIAKGHLGAGDLLQARAAFELTISHFPSTEEASKSLYKIAMIDLLEGKDAAALAGFIAIRDIHHGPYTPEATAMVILLEKRMVQPATAGSDTD